MRDEDFIVSKTDPKGRITYTNRIFMEFSGYTEAELLGSQHNIVRHPDMPRAIFRLMWQTLQSGREFNGYVKNLCKDGGFYWVFANVTPSVDINGKLTGYFSVRRKPKSSAVQVLAPLYADMVAEERRVGPKDGMDASAGILDELIKRHMDSYDRFVFSL